jgi:hypothetical protein
MTCLGATMAGEHGGCACYGAAKEAEAKRAIVAFLRGAHIPGTFSLRSAEVREFADAIERDEHLTTNDDHHG